MRHQKLEEQIILSGLDFALDIENLSNADLRSKNFEALTKLFQFIQSYETELYGFLYRAKLSFEETIYRTIKEKVDNVWTAFNNSFSESEQALKQETLLLSEMTLLSLQGISHMNEYQERCEFIKIRNNPFL